MHTNKAPLSFSLDNDRSLGNTTQPSSGEQSGLYGLCLCVVVKWYFIAPSHKEMFFFTLKIVVYLEVDIQLDVAVF